MSPTPPSPAPGIYVPEDYWFLALGPRSAQDMKEVVVVHPRTQAKSLYAPEMLSEVAFAKTFPRDGSDAANPVVIASVGRAVETKGYDDLLSALALLPSQNRWHEVVE